MEKSNELLTTAEAGLHSLGQRLKALEGSSTTNADVARLRSEVAFLQSELDAEIEVSSFLVIVSPSNAGGGHSVGEYRVGRVIQPVLVLLLLMLAGVQLGV